MALTGLVGRLNHVSRSWRSGRRFDSCGKVQRARVKHAERNGTPGRKPVDHATRSCRGEGTSGNQNLPYRRAYGNRRRGWTELPETSQGRFGGIVTSWQDQVRCRIAANIGQMSRFANGSGQTGLITLLVFHYSSHMYYQRYHREGRLQTHVTIYVVLVRPLFYVFWFGRSKEELHNTCFTRFSIIVVLTKRNNTISRYLGQVYTSSSY